MPPTPPGDPARPGSDGAALPLETTLGHLIRRAQQVHSGLWTTEFGGEITGPQYAVLSVLARRPSLDQRSAGRLASLDKSSAADVMARLQRKGWLGRDRSSPDSRRNVVALTSVARTALRYITPRVRVVQDRLLQSLSDGERRWFTPVLARVAYEGNPPSAGTGADGEPVDAERADADPDLVALLLHHAPGHLIRRAEQVHRVRWTQRVGTVLTPSQYGLLSAVAWQPGLDQSTAAQRASLDTSTTADIIARLTRQDYVGISKDERDRRRNVLALTEHARQQLAGMTAAVQLVQADLVTCLSGDDADRLVTCMHSIAYR